MARFFLLLSLITPLALGMAGAQDRVIFKTPDFTSIKVKTPTRVYFTQGDSLSVKAVFFMDDLQEKVEVGIHRGTLVVDANLRTRKEMSRYNNLHPRTASMQLFVTMPVVEEITTYSTSSFEIQNDLRTERPLTITAVGPGNLSMKNIYSAAPVNISLDGPGDLTVLDVEGSGITLQLSGPGDFTTQAITSVQGDADISLSGPGDMKSTRISAQKVKINVTGPGDLQAQSITAQGNTNITLTGPGDMLCGPIHAGNLLLQLTGPGDMTVGAVTARMVSYEANGPGDLIVGPLKAQSLQANASGPSSLKSQDCVLDGPFNLQTSGASSVTFGTVRAPDASSIYTSSASDATLRALFVPEAKIRSSGASSCTVQGGETNELSATTSAAAWISAKGLKAQNATVSGSGAGSISLNAAHTITVKKLSRTVSLRYTGKPRVLYESTANISKQQD